MPYVMAYVASVPEGRKDDFIESSRVIGEMFRELGATRVVECWGEDVPPGKLTSFPMAVKAEEGETVIFGWQEYPDKATRDRAWEASRSDPRMSSMEATPIDGKRMIFAGFDSVLDL